VTNAAAQAAAGYAMPEATPGQAGAQAATAAAAAPPAEPGNAAAPKAPPRPNPSAPAVMERWAEAILQLAKRLHVSASPEAVRKTAVWSSGGDWQQAVLSVARSAGLSGAFVPLHASAISPSLLPLVVEIDAEQVAVIVARLPDGRFTAELAVGDTIVSRTIELKDEGNQRHRALLLEPMTKPVDDRVSDYAPTLKRNWLREIFALHRGVMVELAAGSVTSNTLAVASAIFSMQIWDRVVPARSLNTLWVLALGVGMALAVDFVLRVLRSSLADHFGKKADLELSDFFYSRLLDMRNDARPRSPGSLIAQMRDFEAVRELLTSTAFGVLLDVPFVIIFIIVMFLLGGELAFVPLVAAPLIVIPGLLMQYPLANLAKQGMAEAAVRNAILMESVYRVEDIKGLQCETRFRRLWRQVNEKAGIISIRQRIYASVLMTFAMTTQQIAYIAVIVTGVYGIFYSGLSTGTVLACSILIGRTLSPLNQIPAALTRLQNARVAKEGLDNLLQAPVDHDPVRDSYHKPVLRGQYRFDKVQYAYEQDAGIALNIGSLSIEPGERIAVLGRTGSGKTTFLRLLSGMAIPQSGRITLDGTPLDLIDVGDVRRNIGTTLQDSSLFYGSLRENLVMGDPLANNQAIERALRMTCADRLLLSQPHGLDLKLRESGQGLSGGQKQVLILSRMLLRDPNILLLDEPTSALDEGTEQEFIRNLQAWIGTRTLIAATHRYALLPMMTRVIVIDGGRIVLDKPREEALAMLRQGVQTPAGAQQARSAQAVQKPVAATPNVVHHAA
jgi:ATP-binding cassette subfamily C protein LapB